jgi:hypothetical protein
VSAGLASLPMVTGVLIAATSLAGKIILTMVWWVAGCGLAIMLIADARKPPRHRSVFSFGSRQLSGRRQIMLARAVAWLVALLLISIPVLAMTGATGWIVPSQ